MARLMIDRSCIALACVIILAPAFVSLAAPQAAATRLSIGAKSPTSTTHSQTRRHALSSVKTWAVQLRHLDREQARKSPLDLIVIDHAPHPEKGRETPYSAADLEPLKTKPDGSRRLVIGYLSIGEAENYRYYWRPEWDADNTRPAWLGSENPDWPRNFLVKYADPAWQSIIFGSPAAYLDRIIAAGFDGVYLDRADAFQDAGQESPTADDAMASFISRLADHARRSNPKFIIIMQNGEELVRYKSLRQRLDGVSKEDLIYGQDNGTARNPPEMIRDSLRFLRQARRDGISIMVLEYMNDVAKRADAELICRREGFALHVGDRLLGTLSVEGSDARAPNSQ